MVTVKGYSSVNMKCDRSPITMSCRRESTNFKGADLINTGSSSIEECVTFCRDGENCKAITFIEATKRCYLKSMYGGAKGPIITAGYTSMNMECDNSTVNLDCLREGINFAGADLNNVVAADEKECARHCRDTELCVAFTFIVSSRRCYLKSRRGGLRGPTKVAGYNSMNMVCDNSPVTNLDCLRYQLDFPGAGMSSILVADVEECVRYCRDAEGCKALTYIESSQRCSSQGRGVKLYQSHEMGTKA